MGLHPVPTHHRDGDSVDCSRSYALPVFDGLIAAGSASVGAAALAQNRGSTESSTLTTVAAVALPLAVITAISAKRGFDSVRRCRRANAAEQRRRFGAIPTRPSREPQPASVSGADWKLIIKSPR